MRAGGLRGRRVRRRGTRCEGYCRGDAKRALDRALPAPGNGHAHEAHATRGVRAGEWIALSSFDGLDEFVGSPVGIEA
jgi:hypothetical protein